jgi:hypothetical protein
MAKKTAEETPEMINGNVALPEELQPVQRDIRILSAKIKDDFCTYDYEYLTGPEKGIVQSAKKSIYIIDNDMKEAFSVFNVHLAVIDDLFKNAGVEIEDIDVFHSHDFTYLMECTEFKILGDDETESIVLLGTKHVSLNGRIKIETPKIPLDNLSSYKWYNELKTAAEKAREEVQLYKAGKYTIPEEHQEPVEDLKQTKILFEREVGRKNPEGQGEQDAEPGSDTTTEDPNDLDEIFGGAKI